MKTTGIIPMAMAAVLAAGVGLAQTTTPGADSTEDRQGTQSDPQDKGRTSDKNGTADTNGTANTNGTDASMTASLAAADRKFMEETARANLAEVELSQLAAEKASSEEVKSFAQRMVDDHKQASERLRELAEQKDVTLPAGVDEKKKSEKAKLEQLSGQEFDRAYVSAMLQGHKRTVSRFQKQAKSGRDEDVKEFASETLPTLQSHLDRAQTLAQQTKQQRPQESGQDRQQESGASGEGGR